MFDAHKPLTNGLRLLHYTVVVDDCVDPQVKVVDGFVGIHCFLLVPARVVQHLLFQLGHDGWFGGLLVVVNEHPAQAVGVLVQDVLLGGLKVVLFGFLGDLLVHDHLAGMQQNDHARQHQPNHLRGIR